MGVKRREEEKQKSPHRPGMYDKVYAWLDDRVGPFDPFMREMLYHRVPRFVNPADFLGLVSIFLFVNQMVTGILLATYYQASSKTAYASIQNIMNNVPGGWVVRDLHYWGANAMIVAVFFHMLRVFYVGAYKKPRELTWLFGVGLLLVTILLGFTGYLLPWDNQSYWATMVGTAMATYTPIIGPWIQGLARGGAWLSTTTLTRFYALHMLVLPGLLMALFAGHFGMVLKKNMLIVEEAESLPPEKQKGLVTFFPYTVFQMTMLLLFVGAILMAFSLTFKAPLIGPAQPLNQSHYNPVPLWYFFSIYQLLKYIPPALDPWGIIGLPGAAITLLVLLPFLDRNPRREAHFRVPSVSVAGVIVASIFALTYIGYKSQASLTAPSTGLVANPKYSTDISPIFQAKCAVCHIQATTGGLSLKTYGSLTSTKSILVKGAKIVDPGHPSKSVLIKMLEGKVPGAPQMPLGGPYLSKTQIANISTWIKQGAKNN